MIRNRKRAKLSYTLIKSKQQINGIRESGKINSALLDYISPYITAGISTAELDLRIREKTLLMGGIPAPLDYHGYPKSICTSINSVVCHGIPAKDVILQNGDIINIDVSTIYRGYFSDSSRMFCIGEVSAQKQRLVQTAKECMKQGVRAVAPGAFLGNIGQAVTDHATANSFSVVREIGGHGIGLEFHEDPWVSYVSKRGTGMRMQPGMVFTVEPMINMGTAAVRMDALDNWTIYTADGLPSAQWEQTILVTDSGYEVLAY